MDEGRGGRYQWLLGGLLCGAVVPATSLVCFGNLLLLLVPPHWCKAPPAMANISQSLARHLLVPFDRETGEYSRCQMYQVNPEELLTSGKLDPDPSWPLQECQYGWEYDYSLIYPTIASERDWVCNNDWKVYFCHTLFWTFSAIGGILFGALSSKVGRVPVLCLGFFLGGTGGLLTSLANSLSLYAAGRAVVGVTVQALSLPAYIIVLEYAAVQSRLKISTLYMCAFAVVCVLMQGYSWYQADWRVLSWVCTVPVYLTCIPALFFPESIRWMITKGKDIKARKTLAHIVKFNKGEVDKEQIADIKFPIIQQESVFKLVKCPKLFRMTMTLNIMWIFVSNSTMISAMAASLLASNPFLMTSLNCVADVSGNLLCRAMAGRLGRVLSICYASVASAIFYLAAGLIPQTWFWPSLAALWLARSTAVAGYGANFLYGTEIMPTVVRNEITMVRLAFASVGFLLSPQILYLGKFGRFIPYTVTAVLLAIAAVISLGFPETLGRSLPDTLEEAENFIGTSKLQLPCFKKQQPTEKRDSEDKPQIYVIAKL